MSESSGEKTEQPTQKSSTMRAKKGQVAKSQDLVSAALLVGSMGIVFLLTGNFIGGQVVGLTQKAFSMRQPSGASWTWPLRVRCCSKG